MDERRRVLGGLEFAAHDPSPLPDEDGEVGALGWLDGLRGAVGKEAAEAGVARLALTSPAVAELVRLRREQARRWAQNRKELRDRQRPTLARVRRRGDGPSGPGPAAGLAAR